MWMMVAVCHSSMDVWIQQRNYDPTANTDDGSCGYCDLTDTLFSNPDPTSGTNCAVWILVTPSKLHTPFTYLWSNGATSNNIFGLCNGIYTVTITDAVGCSVTLRYNWFYRMYRPNSN